MAKSLTRKVKVGFSFALHYAFLEKEVQKCSALYSSLYGFSSKNREILHKAVLTPQEYKICFLGEKNLLGVFLQVKIGLKRNLMPK